MTGINPEQEKVLAIVVLNVRELMHIFRRIWQDFGPFPLIGCDSEGLVWHFNYEKNIQYKRHELISTSGFVITADQGNLLKGIDNVTKPYVRRLLPLCTYVLFSIAHFL